MSNFWLNKIIINLTEFINKKKMLCCNKERSCVKIFMVINMIMTGTNKIAKTIKSLKERKYRDETGLFIAEGLRFVNEIPKDYEISMYAFSQNFVKDNKTDKYENRAESYVFDDKVFKDFSDTNNPQGIIAVVKKKVFDIDKIFKNSKNGLFIIAEELNDPGNLGTVIRTADACNADGIFLSKGSVDLYNSKVLRSTMGSLFHIPVITDMDIDDCMDICSKNNVKLYAAHLKGVKTPYELDFKKPTAFVIGNEARGLSDKTAGRCDVYVKIPMPGKAESLNASVAAAVLMYEAVRQRL